MHGLKECLQTISLSCLSYVKSGKPT